jgi:hypothetical protein
MTTSHADRVRTVTAAEEVEVVAGLVNDGSAVAVAQAAVAEAARHRAAVRFVQVLPPGLDADARESADVVTFQAALRALRGHGRMRVTFEVVVGDPALVLTDRGRDSCSLVVGEDSLTSEVKVAAYCRAHARCPVLVVPTGR